MTYVPNYEQQYYPVHPGQLKRGMSTLGQIPGNQVLGYAPDPAATGMYIIVVQVPAGTAQQDWQAAPARRKRGFTFDVRRLVTIFLMLVIVGGIGYLGYTAMQGGAIPSGKEMLTAIQRARLDLTVAMRPEPQGEPVVQKTGFRWPWESEVISQPKAQAQEQPFEWPWESATKAVGDTVDTVKNVTLGVVVLLGLGLVLWVIGKAKGVMR